MINGIQVSYPLAIVEVESPFYTGRVAAAVMKDSVADLVIGNIQGVRNFCSREATTKTGAAAVQGSRQSDESSEMPTSSICC
ncbi:hypothetical protein E2C01_042187 [Portunus trituberculatus]|uniref:Uncharacterized protein n=1 Tax=Portunus trituberculatus TaxID=210409 RepID=A0A5B7FSY4_PORTR|nr:hypothetical protein [Portunus trituberculatus]